MRKRDQLSVSDIGTSGWAIEGYPVPLTEREAEKIASQAVIIDSLKKQNELLEECVDRYANPDGSRVISGITHTLYLDDIDTYEDAGYKLKLKGKRARETKKKLEELRGEG